MSLHDIIIKKEERQEPEFDSPDGSKWIVAIDEEGLVYVLSRPCIHDSFFECGNSAEELGLPFETENAPGIYEWICNVNYHRDWESGHVDDWEFEVVEEKLLWTWDNGKADEAGNKKAQSDTGAGKL